MIINNPCITTLHSNCCNVLRQQSFANRARPVPFACSLVLMLLCMFLCALAHADQLFDFQMKLANKGNAEAQFKVGEMYETGFGVKQDMKEAENWINMAAGQGHETAGFKLLYWDIEKNGVNDSNRAKVEELTARANSGNAQAQYYLGKMYAHGVGVNKNPDTAIDWLSKAVLVGVLAAERELSAVKEEKRRIAIADRRAQEKQAELKEQEKQQELEKQRRLQAQEQAMAKARAEESARKKAAEEAATRKAAQEAATRKEAEAVAARQAEERRRLAAQKQAAMAQKETEKTQERQFEADPCKGKSARFLSTCR